MMIIFYTSGNTQNIRRFSVPGPWQTERTTGSFIQDFYPGPIAAEILHGTRREMESSPQFAVLEEDEGGLQP